MNFIRRFTRREKILVGIIILLIALLGADWTSTQVVRAYKESILSNNSLYNLAQKSADTGELAEASAYLYAYIQRNPDKYANNIGGYANEVDKVYWKWVDNVQDKADLYDYIVTVVQNCGEYPCSSGDNSAEIISLNAEGFPADKIMVCENKDYKGKCSYLSAGEYTRWQDLGVKNDSISSVQVGSGVKVLLCAHHLQFPAACITLTTSDSNLTNDFPPENKFSMNDNISTAKVSFKPGGGFTLP